jgi:TPR repeat protein
VVKDEAIAVDWYRRSAGQGYGPAFVNLSDCYAQGAGVTKDQVEAYAYARLASQVGAAGPQRLVEMGRSAYPGRGRGGQSAGTEPLVGAYT